MKGILKASMTCWGIVFAFFAFFTIPFELFSPAGAAVTALMAGGGFLVSLAFYIHRLRKKEGIEFGWLVARKHGIWLILLAGAALVLVLTSIIWFLAPQSIEQPLANGAMPVAVLLVLLFWFSIIFMFLGFAIVCFAESAGYFRLKKIPDGAVAFGLALFWVALGAGCCSLFLDVITDNFFRVSGPARNGTLLLVAVITAAIGLGMGVFQGLNKILPPEETDKNRER
jgi:hypothetical protein